jgi:hypothetical protein
LYFNQAKGGIMSIEAKQATPHNTLIGELMDSRIPKTDREHAAAREIERLRQAIEQAQQAEPTRSQKMRDAGITRRPKGWDKEQECEPVAWLSKGGKGIWFHEPDESLNATPLYTAPPQRTPLTDEEIINHFHANVDTGSLLSFADGVRYAEAAHGIKEKNNG